MCVCLNDCRNFRLSFTPMRAWIKGSAFYSDPCYVHACRDNTKVAPIQGTPVTPVWRGFIRCGGNPFATLCYSCTQWRKAEGKQISVSHAHTA